jgi:hypothetical protein
VEYHEITQSVQCVSEREFEQVPQACKTEKLSTHGDVLLTANIKICDLQVYKMLYLTQSNYFMQCSYRATSWMSEATTRHFFFSKVSKLNVGSTQPTQQI